MNKHIGEIGEIISVSAVLKRVRIEFATASWSYPADQIEKHLVKELSKSFACTNTNQELWDKYIKWLNKEHNASIVGKSLDCPYYGIDKDGIVNNHSSKHDFDTILSLEEWDEIVNPKSKELPKSFACINTNQELWDKYISWLNKEHTESFIGYSIACPYYGIDKDGIVDNHSSKDCFDTILSLEEWDEIVNPKSKELPKSFACKNTNQELWDKYIKWFNTTYNKDIYGDSDVFPYYGITTNGVYSYHTSIDFFDTILSLEEWDEIVNGTETKTEKTMKKYEITRQELKKIHDVACNAWKNTIEIYGIRNPFGNTIKFTQIEVDKMFGAAIPSQIPVLENIFGKQTAEIDLSTGKVDGKILFDINRKLTNALMCVRASGKYENIAFILNDEYNWDLVKDTNHQLCLVPTRK